MNTQNRTYRCFRCGKRFTKYGRQAEILDDVEALLAEYRILINDPKAKKLKYTCLEMVEVEAKCCKDPFILHTYPKKEDRL